MKLVNENGQKYVVRGMQINTNKSCLEKYKEKVFLSIVALGCFMVIGYVWLKGIWGII